MKEDLKAFLGGQLLQYRIGANYEIMKCNEWVSDADCSCIIFFYSVVG